jgi:tape measure domain-containing protein
LQTAVGSVERAGEIYEALYRNALQTGVAVSESVDAFQRFSIAAREIGATSDQVVRLVSGLQKAAIISGASAQEVSAATTQLAQALASGVLQGDELRSVLENMPVLAEALAKELGTSIGQMRQLGKDGQLTAERVFPALLRATERIGTELDKAPASLVRREARRAMWRMQAGHGASCDIPLRLAWHGD